ncbi:MAG: arylsulfatase [Puniceicoccaceae bacterium]
MKNYPQRIRYIIPRIAIPALACMSLALSSLAASRPNVVIIYGDDVGYGDVGVNGSTLIPTPNIDRLAAEGLNFTDGHCTASTCTPSRFSLLTGIHAFRYKARILPPNAPLIVPTDEFTLGSLFKKVDYRTSIIGKWHLGLGEKRKPVNWNSSVKPGPMELGFDYSFLVPSTNDRVPCVYLKGHHVVGLEPTDPLYVARKLEEVRSKSDSTQYPYGVANPEAMTYYKNSTGHADSVINGIGRIGFMAGGASALWDDETISDVLVAEAVRFIEENKEEPFFLFFSAVDIHVPRTPHPRFQGSTSLGYRGDAMVQFDWATGAIMESLEKHGLKNNTIVIFSSDNGPAFDNGYKDGTTVVASSQEVDGGHDASGIWRGGKGQIWEAGTRVPFIIRWPANIQPGTSAATVSQVDLLASFAALLGVELQENEAIDSRNLLSAFLGKDEQGSEYLIEESFNLALRHSDWKYVEATRVRDQDGKPMPLPESLFKLDDDRMEQNNLIERHPEKAASMKAMLESLKNGDGLRNELGESPNNRKQ